MLIAIMVSAGSFMPVSAYVAYLDKLFDEYVPIISPVPVYDETENDQTGEGKPGNTETGNAKGGSEGAGSNIRFVSRDANGKEILWLDGSYISEARVIPQDYPDSETVYLVEIRFDEKGKELFAEATTSLVGDTLYVMNGEEVIFAPAVREPITEGSAVISAFDNLQEADALVGLICPD